MEKMLSTKNAHELFRECGMGFARLEHSVVSDKSFPVVLETQRRSTLTTRWYDNKMTQFGSGYHRRISLTVTYTFNYGKKVSQYGELNGEKNISTSILH